MIISASEAIAELRGWQSQIIHGTNIFGRIADLIFELERAGLEGCWLCEDCGFQLQKSVLNPSTGQVGVDLDETIETCPNDSTRMVPLTWRVHAEALAKGIELQVKARVEVQDAAENLLKVIGGAFDWNALPPANTHIHAMAMACRELAALLPNFREVQS